MSITYPDLRSIAIALLGLLTGGITAFLLA